MEGFVMGVFFLSCLLFIAGGATNSDFLCGSALVLFFLSIFVSLFTGAASSFGPKATHSNRFPYHRKGGRRG